MHAERRRMLKRGLDSWHLVKFVGLVWVGAFGEFQEPPLIRTILGNLTLLPYVGSTTSNLGRYALHLRLFGLFLFDPLEV